MSTITADATLKTFLGAIKEVTEIRDANGNVLGTYTPRRMSDEEVMKLFDLKKAKETLARERDQCRPFREVIAKLEKMAENQG